MTFSNVFCPSQKPPSAFSLPFYTIHKTSICNQKKLIIDWCIMTWIASCVYIHIHMLLDMLWNISAIKYYDFIMQVYVKVKKWKQVGFRNGTRKKTGSKCQRNINICMISRCILSYLLSVLHIILNWPNYGLKKLRETGQFRAKPEIWPILTKKNLCPKNN